eukprot:SAG31_NODE_373_length_16597_cov_21.519518_2_plen_68_part_00
MHVMKSHSIRRVCWPEIAASGAIPRATLHGGRTFFDRLELSAAIPTGLRLTRMLVNMWDTKNIDIIV